MGGLIQPNANSWEKTSIQCFCSLTKYCYCFFLLFTDWFLTIYSLITDITGKEHIYKHTSEYDCLAEQKERKQRTEWECSRMVKQHDKVFKQLLFFLHTLLFLRLCNFSLCFHSLSFLLSQSFLSLLFSLFFSFCFSLFFSLSFTLTYTIKHAKTHTLTLFLSHTPFLHSRSSLTNTIINDISLSVSVSLTICLSFSFELLLYLALHLLI